MVPGSRYAAGIQVPMFMGLLTTGADGTIDIGTTSAPPNWSNVVAYKKGSEPSGIVPPTAAGSDYDVTMIGTWTGPEQDYPLGEAIEVQGVGSFGIVWAAPVTGSSSSSSVSPSTPSTPSTTQPPCEWWNVPCWPTWAKIVGAIVVVGGVAGVAVASSDD